jgi:hypothetical protein
MVYDGKLLPLLPEQEDIHLAFGISYERAELVYRSLVQELEDAQASELHPNVVSLLLGADLTLLSVNEVMLASFIAASLIMQFVGSQPILHTQPEAHD